VLAIRAEFHSVGLGDSVLLLKARVLLDVNCLYGNLGVSELVMANHYGVAAALANFV